MVRMLQVLWNGKIQNVKHFYINWSLCQSLSITYSELPCAKKMQLPRYHNQRIFTYVTWEKHQLSKVKFSLPFKIRAASWNVTALSWFP